MHAFVIELVSNLDRYVDPAVTSLSCNVVDSLADQLWCICQGPKEVVNQRYGMGHLILYPVLTWFITISYVLIAWYSYVQGQEGEDAVNTENKEEYQCVEEASSPLSLACRLPTPGMIHISLQILCICFSAYTRVPNLYIANCRETDTDIIFMK
jgi:hypothetical protein